MNKIKTVNNSNLPINIKIEHHILELIDKFENVFEGPTSPKPGPTFPKELAAPPIEVVKSEPNKLNTPAPIMNSNKYIIKKPRTFSIEIVKKIKRK